MIEANDISDYRYINKHFIYRRVKEKYLLKILSSKDGFKIQERFHQLFIDSLMAGEYKSLDNGKILNLTTDGIVKGFKKYNQYYIHDYFGTQHPFGNYDAICFEDTTVVWRENTPRPKTAGGCYNWKFSDDKLTLTEMLTNDDEQYFLSKKTYKFKRTHAFSHQCSNPQKPPLTFNH